MQNHVFHPFVGLRILRFSPVDFHPVDPVNCAKLQRRIGQADCARRISPGSAPQQPSTHLAPALIPVLASGCEDPTKEVAAYHAL